MDTDSVIDVSLSGKPPIDIDHTGELDLWINEGKIQKSFIEFISSGRKSGIQTCSGFNIIKSNGFYLNHTNRQIFDFDALKEQVVAHAQHIPMNNLVLPLGVKHSCSVIISELKSKSILEKKRGCHTTRGLLNFHGLTFLK